MPTYNLSDTTSVQTYANATNAILKINSVTVAKSEVHFPAFLTDFSQNFDATWNTEEVFGRMDPIATYQGTKRTMSLGFDVPAGSLEGAKDNLKRCEKLISMVYPVYKRNILSRPPLVRITFANLINAGNANGLLGWISGLSWKPNLEMGMFTTGEELYPKVISISFSFNILHEKTLSQESLGKFPFGG
tara:strand:+ start:621 stop:1187 length:567 start_codon:yes stop_codon:yes gene_type:complete